MRFPRIKCPHCFSFSSRQKPGRFTDSAAPHQRIVLSERSRFLQRVLRMYQRISQSQLSMRRDDSAKYKNHLEAVVVQLGTAATCPSVGAPGYQKDERTRISAAAGRELTGSVSSFSCSKHHLGFMDSVVNCSDRLIQQHGSNIYLPVCPPSTSAWTSLGSVPGAHCCHPLVISGIGPVTFMQILCQKLFFSILSQ